MTCEVLYQGAINELPSNLQPLAHILLLQTYLQIVCHTTKMSKGIKLGFWNSYHQSDLYIKEDFPLMKLH